MDKLVLIDGNSLLNRAFYATPVFTTKDGKPTNGVFGFVKLLLKIMADKNPTHLAVAFDVHAPTFRHLMYTDYKAGRKPMPEDLASQFPVLKEVLTLMHIRVVEMAGHEADDIIGTLAKKFDLPTYIYTGDRDAYQLVDDTTIVCFTRKGVSDILELTADNFVEEIGISPLQIIDLKSLMGDKSDNIPGVAGIGEKTAYTLLHAYGNLDGIYQNINEIKGATQAKLINGKETAYFSYKLATIEWDAPIDVCLEDCRLTTPFPYSVKEKFAELEFKSLIVKNIYAEKEETTSSIPQTENASKEIKEIIPESIADAIAAVENSAAKFIAAHLEEQGFRFYLPEENKEYYLPIKIGLLDVGFYDYQFIPLLRCIYSGTKKIISYNAKDTMHALRAFEVEYTANFVDVSILKCLFDGLSNSDRLEFCLQSNGFSERYKAYGVSALYELYIRQLRAQEKKLYENVELPLVRVLYAMETQGVCVDVGALEELSARYTKELAELVQRIYLLAGEEFNINSTQQLGRILFEKLHIGDGVKKNKESKSYKTTAEELEKYADKHEIARCLLRYRKIQKINSTYIEGFKPLVVKGRVHTTYNQNNTQTGRLSSANPNLQNIPIRTEEGRELRKLFTASEGNVLIDADYSQIELRLLSHFSKSKELIAAYCEEKDIHTITASQVFGVPVQEVTSAMRRNAKAVNFGIIYGISAFGLSTDLGISSKQAQEYIDRYFQAYSNVKDYMEGNVERAKKDGYLETLLGRRRVFNELKSSNYNVRSFGERAAMNMPLQGSSADIIKVAMINVFNRLDEGNFKAKLVLQVHDELVIDCPEEEKAAVSTLLKEEMENAVKLLVPLTVDISVGKTWYDTKE